MEKEKSIEERRKENPNIIGLDSDEIYREYYKLRDRIDKAMEFIEGEVGIMPMLYGGYMACDELTKVGIGELYEILEGDNNE